MTSILLDNLAGMYKGNVEHVFANLGYLKKTGYVHIKTEATSLSISCGSLFKRKLTEKFPMKGIAPFFNEKKEIIKLKDGRTEERVAFINRKDDDWLFPWLRGLTQTVTAYQLKFLDSKLNAFRVQQYNTLCPSELNYFLEVSNLIKEIPKPVDPVKPPEPKKESKPLEPAKPKKESKPLNIITLAKSPLKTDWDF